MEKEGRKQRHEVDDGIKLDNLTSRHRPNPSTTARTTLFVALLGFFVITLDALVINVVLPPIERDLGGGMTGKLWVVDGYTLMFAALLLFAGTLSDRIGARQSFRLGFIGFIVASAACAAAPTIATLVVARFAQGAGAAIMLPASLALVREAFHDPVERARAIAIWAIGGAVASIAGPVVGGLLSLISWRLIFFINLPVGVIALVMLARVPRSIRREVPFDWIGQAAALITMVTLIYGLIEGGALGFSEPLVVASLLTAAVSAAVFVIAQVRGRHPMVPPSLLASRPVLASLAVGSSFMIGFYGLVFLYSLYFQEHRDLSAAQTGLVFLPMTGVTMFINPIAARLAERFGLRLPLALGQTLMASGLIAATLVVNSAPIWLLSVMTIPIGIGGALSIPIATGLIMNSVPGERAGIAGGVLNTCRQVSGALAIAIFGAMVANEDRFLTGLRVSFTIAAVVLIGAALACLVLLPPRSSPVAPEPVPA